MTKSKMCSVHEIRKPFKEMEVCWNRASKDVPWRMIPETNNDDTLEIENGGDIVLVPVDTSAHVSSGKWQQFTVTASVKRYLESSGQNNGFTIRSKAELKEHVYQSSEYSDISQRPKLVFYCNGVSVINVSRKINHGFKILLKQGLFVINTESVSEHRIYFSDLSGRFICRIQVSGFKNYNIPVGSLPTGLIIASVTFDNETKLFTINNYQ